MSTEPDGDADDTEGTAPNEWDEYADGWDEDEAARAYAAAAFSSLLELLDTHQLSPVGAGVLDFGCGTGLLTEQLVGAASSVHAVDTSPAMLAVVDSKRAQQGWTTVTTSTQLPSPSFRCDLVVCSSVCSFLPDYPGTAAQLASYLRPGGVFVQWDWERVDDEPHGLGRAEIAAALAEAGLSNISVDVGFNVPMGDQTMSPLMGSGKIPQG